MKKQQKLIIIQYPRDDPHKWYGIGQIYELQVVAGEEAVRSRSTIPISDRQSQLKLLVDWLNLKALVSR